MSIKILHTADWHIGNFNGPEQDGENARFKDICKCLDVLTKSSKREKPDITLVSGDIFHAAKVWSDRGLRENQTAISYINKLSYDCPVIVMRGTPNHDSKEQFNSLEQVFCNDPDVYIVTEPKVIEVMIGDQMYINIACLPGFDRGYFRARNPGLSRDEENEVFTKFLAETVTGLKAQCDPRYPSVFMAHYTVPGCNMESGQAAFFKQLEPVIYPDTLNAAGFDLVCLGHIHRPQRLPICGNAFYSGAVSQINFNDEGQKRGFYYHYIGKNNEIEKSDFTELPTREFHTIELDNEDIQKINERRSQALDIEIDDIIADDVNGKIVRVIYDCTDDNNKAFDHKALSDYLYRRGAFYVQEVTPRKISITVDKKAMDSDDSPENNLKNYLYEKETPAEQIGEIIELARPIIDEAAGNKSKGDHKGIFVPREIEVKNYRNYREERFSFDNISFCTISGSNGVGKSSLFMDAMSDALFEEPREGDLTGWICNDPKARSGFIKFTFSIGDNLYRVTRTRQKSGKATLNIAEKIDGEWVDRSKEKMRDTQTEIENIIGMDSLTLKACGLIMQDQYGIFLQAGKEERMAILGNILGLGIYSDMEDMAAAKATDINREIRTLSDRIEQLSVDMPDVADMDDKLTEYENQLKFHSEHSRRCEDDLINLRSELKDKEAAAQREEKLKFEAEELKNRISKKKEDIQNVLLIVQEAHSTLIKEKKIEDAYFRLEELTARQKTLIEKKAVYGNLKNKAAELDNDLKALEHKADKLIRKQKELDSDYKSVCITLEYEKELEETHRKYEELRSKIAYFENNEAEYLDRKRTLDMANAQIEVTKTHYSKIIDSIKFDIKECERRVQLLSESGCPISERASCKFLKDAMEAREKLPEHIERLKTAEKDLQDDLNANKAEYDKAEDELKALNYDPNTLNELRQQLRILDKTEVKYRTMTAKKSEASAISERIRDIDVQLEELKKEKSDIQGKIEEVEDMCCKSEYVVREYEEVSAEIEKLAVYKELHDSLPLLRERHKTALDRHGELLKEIAYDEKIQEEKCHEQLTEHKKTEGIEDTRKAIIDVQNSINGCDVIIHKLTSNMAILQKEKELTEEKKKKIEKINTEIISLSKTASGYETLKKAFSQDGIPHNIIRSIIPIFEATATNIIGQMSAGKMSIEIVTEKVLKYNNKKEVTALDVIVNDSDTGELPYMSRSGGERVKAALAVILALSEIKSTKAGIQIGFLAIDEPPFLDENGTQAYVDALETIQKRYPDTKIIAISHDESFKARFPQNITIYKDENGSHLSNL